MRQYRHTIAQFERDARLGNDEVQLLYLLMEQEKPLTMHDAMFQLRATESAARTLLKSLNTKLHPLGYDVRSLLDAGYIVRDLTTEQAHVESSGSEQVL